MTGLRELRPVRALVVVGAVPRLVHDAPVERRGGAPDGRRSWAPSRALRSRRCCATCRSATGARAARSRCAAGIAATLPGVDADSVVVTTGAGEALAALVGDADPARRARRRRAGRRADCLTRRAGARGLRRLDRSTRRSTPTHPRADLAGDARGVPLLAAQPDRHRGRRGRADAHRRRARARRRRAGGGRGLPRHRGRRRRAAARRQPGAQRGHGRQPLEGLRPRRPAHRLGRWTAAARRRRARLPRRRVALPGRRLRGAGAGRAGAPRRRCCAARATSCTTTSSTSRR